MTIFIGETKPLLERYSNECLFCGVPLDGHRCVVEGCLAKHNTRYKDTEMCEWCHDKGIKENEEYDSRDQKISVNVCTICQKQYRTKTPGRSKYCSEECRLKGKTSYLQICEFCGIEYTDTFKTKFCSIECYTKSREVNNNVDTECLVCHKVFRSAKSFNRKYCSRECYNTVINCVKIDLVI
jgi:hypothetical protein